LLNTKQKCKPRPKEGVLALPQSKAKRWSMLLWVPCPAPKWLHEHYANHIFLHRPSLHPNSLCYELYYKIELEGIANSSNMVVKPKLMLNGVTIINLRVTLSYKKQQSNRPFDTWLLLASLLFLSHLIIQITQQCGGALDSGRMG
jgi:hypothetical protein